MRDAIPPCEVLRDMVERGRVVLPGGEEKRLVANISIRASRALYECVLRERPRVMVEVGMAQGVSTLASLAALSRTGGRLVSVDPYVGWKSGREAALHAVLRAGFQDIHRHVEAPSHEALPLLLSEGLAVDFAYIDGAHDFANVFIDAFYLDLMLRPGGVLAFNDAGWKDVHAVITHVRGTGRYEEVEVGLRKTYRGRNPLITMMRMLLGRSREDRYFRKLRGDGARAIE